MVMLVEVSGWQTEGGGGHYPYITLKSKTGSFDLERHICEVISYQSLVNLAKLEVQMVGHWEVLFS